MIRIGIRGNPEFSEVLESINEALDPTIPLDQAAALLLHRMRARFLAQTAPGGWKWKRSRAAEIREQEGRGGDTLFDTGNLFRSIQLSIDPTDPMARIIGTDVKYAPFHQEGKGDMFRPFIGFNEEDQDIAFRVLARYVATTLQHGAQQ